MPYLYRYIDILRDYIDLQRCLNGENVARSDKQMSYYIVINFGGL